MESNELPDQKYLDCEDIMWHIDFQRTEWDTFDNQLCILMDGYKTNDLMIGNVLLPLDLIKEHPCNVYLCDGKHCHSGHGRVPRNIFIDEKGNMYPYGIAKEELIIGNIFSDADIIKEYEQSESIANFVNINRNLYLQLLDKCNYSIIPWFDILGEM